MPLKDRIVRADGHLDVLGSIPPIYRSTVLEQCERLDFAKGALIWTQGQPAGYVAFLISGKAMSSYQSLNGKTGTTGFWCAGDLLGAADLGSLSTRQQTVRCLDACVIRTLSFERFDELVRRFPELAAAVIRALSLRLRWVAQLAVTLETQSAPERICGLLLALSERFGVPSDDGVMRQFANATLQDLRKRGLIASGPHSLVITGREGLERLARYA